MKSVLCKMMFVVVMVLVAVAPPVFGQSSNSGTFVSRFGETVDMTGWVWPVNIGFCSGTLTVLDGNYKWSSFTIQNETGQYVTTFDIAARGKVRNSNDGLEYQFSYSSRFSIVTDLKDSSPTASSQMSSSRLTGAGGKDGNGSILFIFHYAIDGNGVVRAVMQRFENNCPS